jgi:hypothetical protein
MNKINDLIAEILDPKIRQEIESRLDISYYNNQPVNDIFDVIMFGWDWGSENELWSMVYETKNLELIKDI